jgi:hypothetical protein
VFRPLCRLPPAREPEGFAKYFATPPPSVAVVLRIAPLSRRGKQWWRQTPAGILRRAGSFFQLQLEPFFQVVVTVAILKRLKNLFVRRSSRHAVFCGQPAHSRWRSDMWLSSLASSRYTPSRSRTAVTTRAKMSIRQS